MAASSNTVLTTTFTFGCTAANWSRAALTNQPNNCRKGLMRTLGRFTILGNAPLRAMLAVLFLVMSALQPGLFATANATGFHAGVHLQAETAAHDMGDHGATADDADTSEHHHGAKQSADKSCEAHCAPANAVPVDCPDLEHVVSRCFAPVVAVTLPLGEYTALIRPPKHLN
ncbi:hypothetical protein [Mesorhizobium sp.]|uniref:hypothetical protein n=1 Tax=Mesorhizobium sp. TaxID=1871066 RepID=UPI000FE47668|nr:hypothetical protein [Mesorhizobium sp.]RWQ07694.1 MAG: hypothetical protein EOR91_12265 [Mesorhizobium sp.]